MIVIVIQVLASIFFFFLLRGTSLRIFRIAALILFPVLWVLYPFLMALYEIVKTSSVPDAVSIAYFPITFEIQSGVYLLLTLLLPTGLQLLLNTYVCNFIKTLRK